MTISLILLCLVAKQAFASNYTICITGTSNENGQITDGTLYHSRQECDVSGWTIKLLVGSCGVSSCTQGDEEEIAVTFQMMYRDGKQIKKLWIEFEDCRTNNRFRVHNIRSKHTVVQTLFLDRDNERSEVCTNDVVETTYGENQKLLTMTLLCPQYVKVGKQIVLSLRNHRQHLKIRGEGVKIDKGIILSGKGSPVQDFECPHTRTGRTGKSHRLFVLNVVLVVCLMIVMMLWAGVFIMNRRLLRLG